MLIRSLELLRCPFCGTRLSVVENAALDRGAERMEAGVLGCECCAFPVVAGIPVLIADDTTRGAMHALEAGRRDEALHQLLGLGGRRLDAFRALIAGDRPPTYRDLLSVLCLDAEADYMLHRYSDPTCVLVEALLDAVAGRSPGGSRRAQRPERNTATARHAPTAPGRALDLCGGSGHFTRILLRRRAGAGAVVVADVEFWKLWLASRILAPDCEPVCCDANSPLPFADARFSTVLLSDAFPYIWHKRLLAGEMRRVAEADGVILMPHLHSAHGENHSAGDTLSPTAYRDLFAPLAPRLFDDRRLFDDVLDRRVVDLAHDTSPEKCGDTPSITLVATRDTRLYRRHDVIDRLDVTGVLTVNPLYRVDCADGVSRLTLSFPTPEYEDEFGLARRYLPERLTVKGDLQGAIDPAAVGPMYPALRRRRVLLDLPRYYR